MSLCERNDFNRAKAQFIGGPIYYTDLGTI